MLDIRTVWKGYSTPPKSSCNPQVEHYCSLVSLQLGYNPPQSLFRFGIYYLACIIYVSVFGASSFHQPWWVSPINQPDLEPLLRVHHFLSAAGRVKPVAPGQTPQGTLCLGSEYILLHQIWSVSSFVGRQIVKTTKKRKKKKIMYLKESTVVSP